MTAATPETFDDAAKLVRSATGRLLTARVAAVSLAMLVVSSLFLPPFLGVERFGDVLGFAGIAAAVVWVFLGVSAAKLGRRVREASALASVGRADLAEGRARETLDSFCLLRPVTLGAAAVLARVRASQGRHDDAARLAAFVLDRPEKALTGEKRGLRLLLADSLISLGNAEQARLALLPLYQPASGDERLALADALRLLYLQLRVEAALDQWQAIYSRLASSLPMVELMPSADMVRSTALLLRAVDEAGDEAWASFLAHRVRLLGDVDAIEADEPALAGRLAGLLERVA